MSACHRGRVEAAKALLRSVADPNYENDAGDLTLFWGIDGGIELIIKAMALHKRHSALQEQERCVCSVSVHHRARDRPLIDL